MTGTIPTPTLEELYQQAVRTPSDINEHLPTLCELARECAHVTEMGTRSGCSTRAFLYAQPAELVCYDLERRPEIDRLEEAARQAGRPRFCFYQADVLQVEIEETDLLFIDTFHVYEHTRDELARHSGKARKYLVFHDTTTFADSGQEPGSRGIWPAIDEFLRENDEWQLAARLVHNNGLTVLRRATAARNNRPSEPRLRETRAGARMIYDCFPFFNELELLEIRLHELSEVVDRFVLVESTRTHSNVPKPLYYNEHKHRFSHWSPRIIHVVVDDMPAAGNSWNRENWQRDCIGRGLAEARPEDIILISDVDEIPRAEKVRGQIDTSGIKLFQQRLSYCFLNNVTDEPWTGTRMLSYHDFCRLGGAQAVRHAGGALVPDAGWHLSYMGGVGRIQAKLRAYAHQEYNTVQHTDPCRLSRALATGSDLFGRDIQWRIAPGDNLPRYTLDHRSRYLDWIHEGLLLPEQPAADPRCVRLLDLYGQVQHLPADVAVIGCAEVDIVVALANNCHPDLLWAVGEWAEGAARHLSLGAATPKPHDPYHHFLRSIRILTPGNVRPVILDADRFLAGHEKGFKLCCIDLPPWAGAATLQRAAELILPGGILCGPNSRRPSPSVCDSPADQFPGTQCENGFWWWRRDCR